MSFAELLAEVKKFRSKRKRGSPQLPGWGFAQSRGNRRVLTQLDSDAAHADAGNKVYTIEETREMVKSVVARAGR
jgi:hypothetical protein